MHDRSRKGEKDPIAAELGRRGGIKGGRARAERLSPESRSAIARRAAAARWGAREDEAAAHASLAAAGVARARRAATLTLAGEPVPVAALEDGTLLLAAAGLEKVLGAALPEEAAVSPYLAPGDWQMRRGLTVEAAVEAIAGLAGQGRPEALALLVELARPALGQRLQERLAEHGSPAEA